MILHARTAGHVWIPTWQNFTSSERFVLAFFETYGRWFLILNDAHVPCTSSWGHPVVGSDGGLADGCQVLCSHTVQGNHQVKHDHVDIRFKWC